MKHKLIAYVNLREFPIMPKKDVQALDVINIAFGTFQDGRIGCHCEAYQQDMERMRHDNPELKIVLSVGGWTGGGFSEAADTEEGRLLFAHSALETLERWKLDGLDIDWEYPCIGVAGIESSGRDKENFTKLIRKVREVLDAGKQKRYYSLTIAAGGDSYFTRCTELDKIHDYLDYVQIMTYDLRGGFTVLTGHHTNLYTRQDDLAEASADYAVRCFHAAGVPYEKLVIGAAFYARIWKGVPDRNHGLIQTASTTGSGGAGYRELIGNYINKNGYVRYWDEEAKAPYLFNGSEFVSYDDKESLHWKAEYVREKGILGIMYWEYSLDPDGELTAFLKEELNGNSQSVVS